MRIISLLLSLMLFAVLATHFSPPDDWRSRLSEYVQKSPAPTIANAPEIAAEEETKKEPEEVPVAPAPPAPQPSVPKPDPKPIPEPPKVSIAAQVEAEVLRLSNIEREKIGLNSLSTNTTLAETARAHSRDMLDRDFFSHDNPDDCSSSCRATAAGYRWQTVGENIYMMSGWDLTPEEAAIMIVNGWMSSPGHKENLLKPSYLESGIGIVVQGEAMYATALYGKQR